MGCNLYANGNASELPKTEPLERINPEEAKRIVTELVQHFKCGTVYEMFSKALTRFGDNDDSWARTVDYQYEGWCKRGILPRELVAVHARSVTMRS